MQTTVRFTLGMEWHHPRQFSRKNESHQMRENFSKQKGRARDTHLCSSWLLCSAMGVFMEISTKDTFKLEARHAGVMDSLVACEHSSEFRHCRTASSPQEHYRGFCLKKLQCLSDLWSAEGKCCLAVPFHDAYHPHTCDTTKDEKE